MSEFLHIVDRAFLHFFMASGVLLLALFLWWLAERRLSWWPSRLPGWWAVIVPAFVAFCLISMREVFDVAGGQLLLKAPADWISWLAGFAAGVYALYRATPRLSQVRQEIEVNRKLRRVKKRHRR